VWKETEVYLHLEVYTNMPKPRNVLRLNPPRDTVNEFYDVVHKGTQVQLTRAQGRKWLKVKYPTALQAYNAQIHFYKYTYCFWGGFHIKLWTASEIKNTR
jgi:hypothetical protein